MQLVYFHYLGDRLPLLHVDQFAEAARQLGHDVAVHAVNLALTVTVKVSGERQRAL